MRFSSRSPRCARRSGAANDQNFVATFSLHSLTLQNVTVFPAPQPGIDDIGISWGDALIQANGYAYIYGRSNPQPTRTNPFNFVASAYLARVPAGELGTPSAWSYFTGLDAQGNPVFASGTNAPAEARPILQAGGTYPCQTGVVPAGAGYSAANLGGTYYLFSRDPNSIGSITAYSAADLWGPFSGPAERDTSSGQFGFYTMPVPSDAGSCAGGCTYGPHIHADIAPDANGWLLSYDVNSATLGPVQRRLPLLAPVPEDPSALSRWHETGQHGVSRPTGSNSAQPGPMHVIYMSVTSDAS